VRIYGNTVLPVQFSNESTNAGGIITAESNEILVGLFQKECDVGKCSLHTLFHS
jgi:hypothetical protein